MTTEEKKVAELIGSDLDIGNAIRIAKILASAPEERLPMIIDIFDQAGLEISGMEDIENLKALAKSKEQIAELEDLLKDAVSTAKLSNGEYRIPTESFDGICKKFNQSVRTVRKTLAEMGILKINTVGGKNGFTIPVYDADTKEIKRCVCIKGDWKSTLGLRC